jgi:trimeric autotransporter adhesin
MSSDLFFEGKKYISSGRAASDYGYTRDYIGQLIRGKKIDARMVGRSWYVCVDSIQSYQHSFSAIPRAVIEPSSDVRDAFLESAEIVSDEKKIEEGVVVSEGGFKIIPEIIVTPFLPPLRKKEVDAAAEKFRPLASGTKKISSSTKPSLPRLADINKKLLLTAGSLVAAIILVIAGRDTITDSLSALASLLGRNALETDIAAVGRQDLSEVEFVAPFSINSEKAASLSVDIYKSEIVGVKDSSDTSTVKDILGKLYRVSELTIGTISHSYLYGTNDIATIIAASSPILTSVERVSGVHGRGVIALGETYLDLITDAGDDLSRTQIKIMAAAKNAEVFARGVVKAQVALVSSLGGKDFGESMQSIAHDAIETVASLEEASIMYNIAAVGASAESNDVSPGFFKTAAISIYRGTNSLLGVPGRMFAGLFSKKEVAVKAEVTESASTPDVAPSSAVIVRTTVASPRVFVEKSAQSVWNGITESRLEDRLTLMKIDFQREIDRAVSTSKLSIDNTRGTHENLIRVIERKISSVDVDIDDSTVTNLTLAGNTVVSGSFRLSSLNCAANGNGGTLTTDASGNVVCADDDDSGAAGFSTTSSLYFLSVSQGLAFSTTSANYFLAQNRGEAFSSTSVAYYLSQNQGSLFSTTSAAYFDSQFRDWSITANSLRPTTTIGILISASSTFNGNVVITGNSTTTQATTTALAITGVTSSLLKTNGSGSVVAAVAGTDYASPNSLWATTSQDYWNSQFRDWSIVSNTLRPTTTLGVLLSASSTINAGLTVLTSTSTSATTTNLAIIGITGSTQCLQIDTNGVVSGSGATCGTASGSWATSSEAFYWSQNRDLTVQGNGYLAPTTTRGLIVNASSTIGSGAQAGGLTIYGGATTTGNAYFAGNVGIGTTTISSRLNVDGEIRVLSSGGSISVGYGNTASGGSMSVGYENISSGSRASALGFSATASGNGSVAIGDSAGASGLSSLAIGYVGSAGADYSTAVGVQPFASGVYSVALGNFPTATGYQSVSVGFQNTVTAGGASAFGAGISNSTATSTMIGPSDASKLTILGAEGKMGFVGIGTTTPAWNLQIASTTPYLALTDADAGTNLKHWLISNIGGKFSIGTSSDALSATSSALTITKDGNVGVGVSNPLGILTANGTVRSNMADSSTQYIQLDGGDSTAVYLRGHSSGLRPIIINNTTGGAPDSTLGVIFQANSIEIARASYGGNFGIATSSPFTRLSVGGSAYIGGDLTATGTASTTNLAITSITGSTQCLQVNTLGQVSGSGSACGSGSGSWATSSEQYFWSIARDFTVQGNGYLAPTTTRGLIINASSTIGNGNQDGGLTIYGGATTTGYLIVQGTGTSTFSGMINTSGTTGGYRINGITALQSSTTIESVMVGQGAGVLLRPSGGGPIGATAVGYGALNAATVGSGLTAVGHHAAYLTTGDFNTVVGYDALAANVTGTDSTALGYGALTAALGSYNTAVGSNAGVQIIRGTDNTLLGFSAMSVAEGGDNVVVGSNALTWVLHATGTTAVGAYAGYGGSFGFGDNTNNSLFGYKSGYNLDTGSRNTFLGYQTASTTVSGSNNIVIGYNIALPSVNGSNQLNIGNLLFGTGINGTGSTLSTGNIGIGTTTPNWSLQVASNTPYLALTDSDATTNAKHWLISNNGGKFSIGTSSDALNSTSTYFTITNNGNVGIGTTSPYGKLAVNGYINVDGTTGAYRIDGNTVLQASSTNFTTFVGIGAGQNNNTGGLSSTAVGYHALFSNIDEDSNSAFGARAAEFTTGRENSAFGSNALGSNITGEVNVAIGFNSLSSNISATGTVAIGANAGKGTGSYFNQGGVYVGYGAGSDLTNGSDYNTLVGYCAGCSIGNGANNIVIGADISLSNSLTTGSNNIIIGNNISATSSDMTGGLNIGNLIFGTGLDGTGTTLSTGNIGIGTSSPFAKLSISGSAYIGGNLTATGTASTTNLAITSISGSTQCLHVNSLGQVSGTGSDCGSGGGAAYPFAGTGNSTSTLTQFNAGLTAYASSTIGNSNQNGGLTINGGATTTGSAYIAGRLGLGRVNPDNNLTIVPEGAGAGITIYDSNGGNSSVQIFADGASGGMQLQSGGSIRQFYSARSDTPSYIHTLITSGMMGYGTTSPWGYVSINPNGLTVPAFVIGSSTKTDFIVTNAGLVGIGTTSPYAKLSVVGEIVGRNLTATATDATSTIAGGLNVGNGSLVYDFSTGITSVSALELGALSFDTNAGTVSWSDMTVTSAVAAGTVESYSAQIDANPILTVYSQSDGVGGIRNPRVAIGTTTPYSTLTVWGTTSAAVAKVFEVVNNASTTALSVYSDGTTTMSGFVGIGTSTPARALHVWRSTDGAPVRFEDSNGYCEIDPTTTTWTCTSDRNLKKDINNLGAAETLQRMAQLQAVSFRWNKDTDADALRYGMIAQDVEMVFPELVSTAENGIKSVAYGGFTPFMIEAIKALDLSVKDLQNRVDSIEDRLAALESYAEQSGFNASTTGSTTEAIVTFNASTTIETVSGWLAGVGIAIDGVAEKVISFVVKTITADIAYIRTVEADTITTKNLNVGDPSNIDRSGVTIYDRATRQEICVFWEFGVMKSEQGACDEETNTNTNTDTNTDTDQTPTEEPTPTPTPTPEPPSIGGGTGTTTPVVLEAPQVPEENGTTTPVVSESVPVETETIEETVSETPVETPVTVSEAEESEPVVETVTP